MERKSVLVLKIGGSILDDAVMLNACLTQFALLPQPKILVHGGGAIATKIGAQMGIEARYHNGRRITDAPTLDLVTMVYAGLLNKQVVAQLQSLDCNAFGCTGADGNLIVANKRAASPIDFGFAGDIADGAANIGLINTLFKADITPVFAPITHDGCGQLLNTNADSIAQAIAVSLQQDFDVWHWPLRLDVQYVSGLLAVRRPRIAMPVVPDARGKHDHSVPYAMRALMA